jgi:hypothetical protein
MITRGAMGLHRRRRRRRRTRLLPLFSLSSFPPVLLILPSICNLPSLSTIKGKAGRPTKGNRTQAIGHLNGGHRVHTHTHSFIETWELSTVCNPYYGLSARYTSSSSRLDVGTFCPNQYTSSCLPCIPSEHRCAITNLLVGASPKHRQLAQVGAFARLD